METFYVFVFGLLAAAAAAFELTKPKEGQMSTSRDFFRFRTNYIVVYSLMMGTDLRISDMSRTVLCLPSLANDSMLEHWPELTAVQSWFRMLLEQRALTAREAASRNCMSS